MSSTNVDALSVEYLKSILDRESEAIRNIPVDIKYRQAVELIVEHVHEHHGKIITSGMGKAGHIAQNLAATFASTGTPAIFLHPSEAQHGDLGILGKNDLMILISNSGKTREIVELIHLSRHLVPNIPFICITGDPESLLAKSADVALFTGKPDEVCPLGLTPTSSTIVMMAMGHLLVIGTMSSISFGYEDYSKRHHGGYLGDISRQKKEHHK